MMKCLAIKWIVFDPSAGTGIYSSTGCTIQIREEGSPYVSIKSNLDEPGEEFQHEILINTEEIPVLIDAIKEAKAVAEELWADECAANKRKRRAKSKNLSSPVA